MHARHRPGISREAGYGTWFPCRAPGVLRDRVGFLQVSWMGLGAVRGAGLARCGIQVGAGQGIVCRIFAHAHRRAESLRHKKIASRCACQRLSP